MANNLPLVKVALYNPFRGIYTCRVRVMVEGYEGGLCISTSQNMIPIQAVTLALNLADEILADYRADIRKAKGRA